MSKAKYLGLVIAIILLMPNWISLSAAGLVPCGIKEGDICTICDFVVLIQNLLNLFVTQIIWYVALFMILYAGFLIITSPENKKKDGYELIKRVLIGLAVILLSWAIINTFIYIVAPKYVDPMTGETLQNSWNKINCDGYENYNYAPSGTKTPNWSSPIGEGGGMTGGGGEGGGGSVGGFH